MDDKGRLASGFTLAEILISTLLLSIFAVGTFKSSQFTQTAASAALGQFKQVHQTKQASVIRQLIDRHPVILVDDRYQLLQCLIRQRPGKEPGLKAGCS